MLPEVFHVLLVVTVMFYRPDRRCVPQGALWVPARGQAFRVLLDVLDVLLVVTFMFYRPPRRYATKRALWVSARR